MGEYCRSRMDRISERRLAENELIFRSFNEEAKDFVKEDITNAALAKRLLRFFCECSDLNCKLRIRLTAVDYERLHKTKKQFVLKPGHEIPALEHTVLRTPDYVVVEKVFVPPTPKEIIEPRDFV